MENDEILYSIQFHKLRIIMVRFELLRFQFSILYDITSMSNGCPNKDIRKSFQIPRSSPKTENPSRRDSLNTTTYLNKKRKRKGTMYMQENRKNIAEDEKN